MAGDDERAGGLMASAVAVEALDAALEAPTSPIGLSGVMGSGKTRTAVEIAELAEQGGRFPLLVSPPASAADSGPISVGVLLATLGAELPSGKALRYREGFAQLRQLLYERQEAVVVIADEPSAWFARDPYLGALGREARDVLVGAPAWPTIVLDQASPTSVVASLDAAPTEDEFGAWGALQEAAVTVARFPAASRARTPLDHKLAAAVLAWGGEPAAAPTTPATLAENLRDALSRRRNGPPLWGVWQRLALARTSLPEPVLDALGADRLNQLSKDTLRFALLDDAGRLHRVPRFLVSQEELAAKISSKDRIDVHRLLFQHHYDAAVAASTVAEQRAHAAEALHHGGEAGEEDIADLLPVTFVEQLNALGRDISLKHRDHRRAAAVFLAAIGIDERNDYAQHYRGFNLDFEGERVQEVEQRYDLAVDLQPSNPTWHARRVTFLADIGKLTAAREAWSEAESMVAGGMWSDQLEFYGWIAGALLHQNELAFAEDVLGSVPVGSANETIDNLRLALKARFTAQDEGTVVPAPRTWREWWREGPTQLAMRDTQGRPLVRWSAARVEAIDEDGVEVRIAIVENGDRAPVLGRAVLTQNRMETSFLDAGTAGALKVGQFLEVGEYEHPEEGRRIAVRLVRPDPHLQPAPPLMRLDRWLKPHVAAQP